MTDKLLLDRWMGDAPGEDYVAWAVELLVTGRDTPSLRVLAGLIPSLERDDIEVYFLHCCKELGLELLESSDSPRDAVPFVKRLYQSGTLSPEETVHRMANFYELSDYSDPLLQPWFTLEDALVYGPSFSHPPEEIESLEETIDREWVRFDRAVALDLPDGFQKFVRCNTCRQFVRPARPTFFKNLRVLLTQGHTAPDMLPPKCAKCSRRHAVRRGR
jgi:hypothetical protein